jgi:hypothetical protein
MADFPDPHNWFYPFMSSTGTYSSRQVVTYGLNPSTMNWENTSYGPPPYINAFGESVTGINGTYIDHLISTGVKTSDLDPKREKLYNELFDIYHAEASQLPTVSALARHYERTWINGWIGTFNENPIAPGRYYYTMWKATTATVYSVDISAADTIVNSTKAYPFIQVYLGEMKLLGTAATINYSISVHRKDTTGPAIVYVYVGLLRNSTDTGPHRNETKWLYTQDFYISLPKYSGTGPWPNFTATVPWYEDGLTSTMEVGIWKLSLYASPSGVPLGDEVEDSDLTNNQANNPHLVEAKELVGDIDGTGEVDIFDAITFAGSFGATEGATNWNALCDLDGSLEIDIFDAIMLAGNFGGTIQ